GTSRRELISNTDQKLCVRHRPASNPQVHSTYATSCRTLALRLWPAGGPLRARPRPPLALRAQGLANFPLAALAGKTLRPDLAAPRPSSPAPAGKQNGRQRTSPKGSAMTDTITDQPETGTRSPARHQIVRIEVLQGSLGDSAVGSIQLQPGRFSGCAVVKSRRASTCQQPVSSWNLLMFRVRSVVAPMGRV